jgi:hypothetical protein
MWSQLIHCTSGLIATVLLLQEEAVLPMREDQFEHFGEGNGQSRASCPVLY